MLLLPPSEGKAPGGDGPPWATGPQCLPALNRRRVTVKAAVRRALREGDSAAAGRLLGARGATLAAALEEWRLLDRAATLPAWRRYSGVVWSGLSPATLGPVGRAALARRVHVPSGLWGLVGALDPLPPYRLKMAAALPDLGRLSTWWRPHLTAPLLERAAGDWIIDLLPGEHAAALDPPAIAAGGGRIARVELVLGSDPAGARAAGHAGKHAKGLLARAILEHDAPDLEAIADLVVPGLTPLALRTDRPVPTLLIGLTAD